MKMGIEIVYDFIQLVRGWSENSQTIRTKTKWHKNGLHKNRFHYINIHIHENCVEVGKFSDRPCGKYILT